ncbi:MAG: hypothetical protein WA941_09245 [Nitrososphaeraceae archaeon]
MKRSLFQVLVVVLFVSTMTLTSIVVATVQLTYSSTEDDTILIPIINYKEMTYLQKMILR